MKQKLVLAVVALAIVAAIGFRMVNKPTDAEIASAEAGVPLVAVQVPALSAAGQEGETLFNTNCAQCHGVNAAGRDGAGPPLIHKIYEPGHHGDAAFLVAAKQGVRAHHWPFGNMPPVDGIKDADVAQIVGYVRELQRANGIN